MKTIGKTQLTAIGLALVLSMSMMTGGCASKSAQAELSATERAEQAATRAEAAASRAERAADQATMSADKAERIFNQKMKK